ncbi:hypothetical protein DFH06DRAFT_1124509 [Mycena polygramma]|nr:hypothetical protein DFH06DRAFT_1124509 [Mycena polygramma]
MRAATPQWSVREPELSIVFGAAEKEERIAFAASSRSLATYVSGVDYLSLLLLVYNPVPTSPYKTRTIAYVPFSSQTVTASMVPTPNPLPVPRMRDAYLYGRSLRRAPSTRAQCLRESSPDRRLAAAGSVCFGGLGVVLVQLEVVGHVHDNAAGWNADVAPTSNKERDSGRTIAQSPRIQYQQTLRTQTVVTKSGPVYRQHIAIASDFGPISQDCFKDGCLNGSPLATPADNEDLPDTEVVNLQALKRWRQKQAARSIMFALSLNTGERRRDRMRNGRKQDPELICYQWTRGRKKSVPRNERVWSAGNEELAVQHPSCGLLAMLETNDTALGPLYNRPVAAWLPDEGKDSPNLQRPRLWHAHPQFSERKGCHGADKQDSCQRRDPGKRSDKSSQVLYLTFETSAIADIRYGPTAGHSELERNEKAQTSGQSAPQQPRQGGEALMTMDRWTPGEAPEYRSTHYPSESISESAPLECRNILVVRNEGLTLQNYRNLAPLRPMSQENQGHEAQATNVGPSQSQLSTVTLSRLLLRLRKAPKYIYLPESRLEEQGHATMLTAASGILWVNSGSFLLQSFRYSDDLRVTMMNR